MPKTRLHTGYSKFSGVLNLRAIPFEADIIGLLAIKAFLKIYGYNLTTVCY